MTEINLSRKIYDDIQNLKEYKSKTRYYHEIFNRETDCYHTYIENKGDYFEFSGFHVNSWYFWHVGRSAVSGFKRKTNIKNMKYYISDCTWYGEYKDIDKYNN